MLFWCTYCRMISVAAAAETKWWRTILYFWSMLIYENLTTHEKATLKRETFFGIGIINNLAQLVLVFILNFKITQPNWPSRAETTTEGGGGDLNLLYYCLIPQLSPRIFGQETRRTKERGLMIRSFFILRY